MPRNLLRRQKERLRKYFRNRDTRLSARELSEAVQSMGQLTAPALMVHSSLSACGHIEGGARTVIDVLQAWTGAATLVMPTHSYCYPDDNSPTPCFDPTS